MRRTAPIRAALAALAATLLAACAMTPMAPPEREPVVVWHSWDAEDLEVIEDVVASYEERAGTPVDLVGFDTPQALMAEIGRGGAQPDVYFGAHTLGDDLLERGLTRAYCRPGECEACRGPNPPRWCGYALGDVGDRISPDFGLGEAYCTRDQCPACFGPNPPQFCKVAFDGPAIDIDVPHGAFVEVFEDGVFPIGIPIWWEYGAIYANPGRLDQLGVSTPETADGVRAFAERFPDAVRVGDGVSRAAFDGEPVPLPASADGHPVPFPADVGGAALGDPNPQPSRAGLILDSSDEIRDLAEQVEGLRLLTLRDSRPPTAVYGTYLGAASDRPDRALDLMYELAQPDVQLALFQSGGHLPAHRAALSRAAEGRQTLVEYGKSGLLASGDF